GASVNILRNNGWLGLESDNNFISDKIPKPVSRNGSKPIVKMADSKAAATARLVSVNNTRIENFSNERNKNNTTITQLMTAIPRPVRTMVNLSFPYLNKILTATYEKKK